MPTSSLPDAAPAPTEVLDAEREHLRASRVALAQMRAHTAGLTAQGGDRVSTEHLKQVLYRRMQALADDPSVPLFFGRLDYAAALGAERDETLYIGRRHVTGEAGGEPLVIDWRAPDEPAVLPGQPRRADGGAAAAPVRLPARQPDRVRGRGARRAAAGRTDARAILEAEIERPRPGPMRDIVATIQPEQDVIVRAGLTGRLRAGRARHRQDRGRPAPGRLPALRLPRPAGPPGVLVVGPNDSFLRYIGDVLPALGEIDATLDHRGAGRWPARPALAVRAGPGAGRGCKGDARMAEVLRRAVWCHLTSPAEALVVPRGARRWRVPAYEADEIVAELRARGVRYGAGRAMLPQRLAHRVLLRMEAGRRLPRRPGAGRGGAQPGGQDVRGTALARPRPGRLVLRLLADPDPPRRRRRRGADREEQALLLLDRPARSAETARWTLADPALVDEAADLLTRTPSLGHVVLDEAQDLSPMMLRAVGRRASTGSVTVLGDLAQATTPWATRSWTEALTHLGQPEAEVRS